MLLQNENYTIGFSYLFAGVYYIHIHDIHKSCLFSHHDNLFLLCNLFESPRGQMGFFNDVPWQIIAIYIINGIVLVNWH